MPVCTSSKISSRPLLVAELAQRLEERVRRDAHAALALHRLDQDAGGLRTDRLLDRFEIAERHLVEAVHRRAEAFEIFRCPPVAASVASVRPWNAPSKVMMR
jgi:hypothetical protein